MINFDVVGGSFRDPHGQVVKSGAAIYRVIADTFKTNYEFLMHSGLYEELVRLALLIPHTEVKHTLPGVYKLIKPVPISFVSYPYEWSFSQLKDAALTTLEIQKKALEYGMILKDASAFNIQFLNGGPIFIDTLSFERHEVNEPWIAYRQFCMHFLAPLLLMKYKSLELGKILQIFIDGIPLHMASSLLPARTWLRPSILSHIHLQSTSQTFFENRSRSNQKFSLSKKGMLGIIDSLQSSISDLHIEKKKSLWARYYKESGSYSKRAFINKKKLVEKMVKRLSPTTVWDIGANTGVFSHLVANLGIHTVSIENDSLAVELNYQYCKKNSINNCLPLVVDITNPTPPVGWNNQERMSLTERGSADTLLALALIHHLVISNNIPFINVASYLHQLCKKLIIEFVPEDDIQVRKLLLWKKAFHTYNQTLFESDFSKYFTIKGRMRIENSKRYLYSMEAKRSDKEN